MTKIEGTGQNAHDPALVWELTKPDAIESLVNNGREPIFLEKGDITYLYFPPNGTDLRQHFDYKNGEITFYDFQGQVWGPTVRRAVSTEEARNLKKRVLAMDRDISATLKEHGKDVISDPEFSKPPKAA